MFYGYITPNDNVLKTALQALNNNEYCLARYELNIDLRVFRCYIMTTMDVPTLQVSVDVGKLITIFKPKPRKWLGIKLFNLTLIN